MFTIKISQLITPKFIEIQSTKAQFSILYMMLCIFLYLRKRMNE